MLRAYYFNHATRLKIYWFNFEEVINSHLPILTYLNKECLNNEVNNNILLNMDGPPNIANKGGIDNKLDNKDTIR